VNEHLPRNAEGDKRRAPYRKRKIDWSDKAQVAAYYRAYRSERPDQMRAMESRWRKGNKEKVNAIRRRYRHKYPARAKAWTIKSRYGLSPEQLEALGNICHACDVQLEARGKRRKCVDHCHDSGRVRGVLCARCNFSVGLLDNDPEKARALAAYLERGINAAS
jgi:hypothetical protein